MLSIANAPLVALKFLHASILLACFVICAGTTCIAAEEPHFNDANTAEGWAWALIRQGKAADFNNRCGTASLDSRAGDDTTWNADCRRLSGTFLVNALTQEPWRDQITLKGIHIIGARIVGEIDLSYAKLTRPLLVEQSRIEDDVNFESAQTDSDISFGRSQVAGYFNALRLHCGLSLDLAGSLFKRGGRLQEAKIDGRLGMDGATFDGVLDADLLQVGGSLFMQSNDQNKASFKDVNLLAAKITGQLDMEGATFDGELNANSLQVGGGLFMRSKDRNTASFKDVDLTAAKISGDLDMQGATFVQSSDENKTSFNGVVLNSAKITGLLEMDGAIFDGPVNGDFMHVENSMLARTVRVSGPMTMFFARIDGNVDLHGTTLAGLDMSGATITGDLILGGAVGTANPSVTWHDKDGKPGRLTLRNTHVVSLVDAKDAWPQVGNLSLDGFSFTRLGGALAAGTEAHERGIDWWDEWIKRDHVFSPSPYQQLAAAFAAAGERDMADDVRFHGRVAERKGQYGWSYIVSGALEYVAGFGIGTYAFRVLYWVLGISLLGAIYLRTRVKGVCDGRHGFIWCFGASLSRLLPIIEINKEFSDFFDDPKRQRLTGPQSFVFSVIGVVGWLLGAILIAALSGLTGKT